jgi:hypothetical protein
MKFMRYLLLGALLTATAFAQAPAAAPVEAPFIKGELQITYNTRTQKDGEKPKAGVKDNYRLKVNVANSILFEGTIDHLPFIKNTISSNQQGMLSHQIECFVVNPRNPSQTRNIGRLYGTVPVDEQNVFRFEDGNLRIGIFGAGNAQGFESRVKGLALGKPPAASGFTSLLNKARERISLTKTVNGQAVSIAVTRYDQMQFQSHTLSAGPVMIYPEVTVNGSMLYDYDRSAWHFNNVNVQYTAPDERGRMVVQNDTLTGSIRWVEAPDRATSGKGEYQFDIRVNEPRGTEASIFAGAADEAAFFETSATIPGLVGTMAYQDTIIGETVTQSKVTINLVGNQLTKQQAVYLAKLLLMSCVVPLNAE